jgi:hypothetical protein
MGNAMLYRRVKIINQEIIAAPADKVWAALTLWGGAARASAALEGGFPPNPLGVIGIDFDGTEGVTPRTRILRFSSGLVMRETLLHQDDEARHIYYNIEGIGAHSIRNYLATTDVDEIADNACQIAISARFDIPSDGDVIQAKSFIDIAHSTVFSGMRQLR